MTHEGVWILAEQQGGRLGRVSFELLTPLNKDIWAQVDRLVKEERWPLKELREDGITMEETFIALTKASIARAETERPPVPLQSEGE